jgi:thiol-disulfide isomerase/thioredoxin
MAGAGAESLPAFTLKDSRGGTRSFPSGRPALLAFVKEDCPTCNLTMPLIDAASRAFEGALDVLIVGQEAEGNALLERRFRLASPVLDDSALAVSYRYEVETVPTLFLADASGSRLERVEGFYKQEWQSLFARAAELAGRPGPSIDWSAYPELQPGCGSRSLEPGIAERLAAEAEGSPLRARRIDIAPSDDEFEFMFDHGLTDGLPVVPPTPERVIRMLAGTSRGAQEVVAIVPPNLAPATVEKVAINAVMAGCRPEYLPVVIAALEAVCTDEFNVHGVSATTWGASPVIVVNGPIRHRLGLNMKGSALGAGFRPNSTIGRAVRLVLRNVGGTRPHGVDQSTLASPLKYGVCLAEWEERSPWEPLHVERGFRLEESVVTVFALEAPHQIADQQSRTARALAGSLGLGMESSWHPKQHLSGDVLLVICPEHADTFRAEGWSKADLRRRVQDVTSRPARDLLASDDAGARIPPGPLAAEDLDRRLPKFRSPDNIHVIVAGGDAGMFSAVFGGWVTGPAGSLSVSRKIEEAP